MIKLLAEVVIIKDELVLRLSLLWEINVNEHNGWAGQGGQGWKVKINKRHNYYKGSVYAMHKQDREKHL